MKTTIRTNIENLVFDLSSKKIANLVSLIENGTLNKNSNPFEIKSKLDLTAEETTLIQNALGGFDDPKCLLLSIDLISEIQKLQQTNQESNSLVWTSPFVFNESADNTETTLLDMINSAKKSITIVGYTIEKDTKEIFTALENAANHGISVKLLFDNAEKFAELVESMWDNKGTLPQMYSYKPNDLKKSSLHAKIMIIDDRELLITSANLTGRGITRNVEIGIRHKGNSAKEAEKLVRTLIENGYLVKI
jgi:phosphatidylserine/phosphatidylglycerophosphate/cardiolipin synthase-like enzyme